MLLSTACLVALPALIYVCITSCTDLSSHKRVQQAPHTQIVLFDPPTIYERGLSQVLDVLCRPSPARVELEVFGRPFENAVEHNIKAAQPSTGRTLRALLFTTLALFMVKALAQYQHQEPHDALLARARWCNVKGRLLGTLPCPCALVHLLSGALSALHIVSLCNSTFLRNP